MCLARQAGLTQEMLMSNRFNFVRSFIAVILGMALLVAGCDAGNSGSSPADGQANPGAVAEAARNAANAAADASENASTSPQQAVISERLPYGEVDDQLVYGHFVFPADMIEPLPAVIVIHEWWGLNDSVRAQADRLAAEGYIVLAIDLYGGEIATSVGAARQYMLRVIENPEIAQENIQKAYEFVSEVAGAPQTGSMGWGFGGGWSLKTALLFPDELDAVVIYYGQVTTDAEELRLLNVPILAHFGGSDKSISVGSVRNFEDSLERLRKNYDIRVYPGAEQSFADPMGGTYNAKAAEQAWTSTLEFLGRNLSYSSAVSE